MDKAALAFEMRSLARDDEAARIEMARDVDKIKSQEKAEEEGDSRSEDFGYGFYILLGCVRINMW
jgi:hypothetical protein